MASSFDSIPQISVKELAQRLSQDRDAVQFVDVREPQELAIAQLEGFQNFPLSQYAEWCETIAVQLDPQRETLVLCHHGIRSAQMCQWLIQQGFTQVKNIVGGIDAYSALVDPSVPRY
jgi:rhodanese-related sulfurtransferase